MKLKNREDKTKNMIKVETVFEHPYNDKQTRIQ